MRTIAHALALVLAGALLAVPTAAPAAGVAPSAGGAGSDDSCPETLYFLARGDGEAPQGPASRRAASYPKVAFGGAGKAVATTVRPRQSGARVVVYPALPPTTIGTRPRAWARSVQAGARNLGAQLATANERPCLVPAAKVLVGHGAGALAIRLAVAKMPRALQDQIDAVVLYGDPSADSRERVRHGIKYVAGQPRVGIAHAAAIARKLPRAALRPYPAHLRPKVISFCAALDAACRLMPSLGRARPVALAKAWVRSARVQRVYSAAHITRDAGRWIERRLPRERLAPRLDWDRRALTVGREVTLPFAGTGQFPPFEVSLSAATLGGTGLSVAGSTVVGTPLKQFSVPLGYRVVDGLGRATTGTVTLRADYTAPAVQLVDQGGAQDADGNNIGSPSLSADGRFVAFGTAADGRYGPDSNGRPDVYLRDVETGSTLRVSGGVGGAETDGESVRPDISADGSTVVFSSSATNLVVGETSGGVFAYDRISGTTSRVGDGDTPSVSADGRIVAALGRDGITIFDRAAGTNRTLLADASVAEFAVSGDGQWLVATVYTNPGSAVVMIRTDGTGLRQVSTVPYARDASISADGRFVAYGANPEPPFFGNVYLTDTVLGATTLVAESQEIDGTSLSADGSVLVYEIVSCRGEAAAVAAFDRHTGGTRAIWDSRRGSQGFQDGYAATPRVSADGRHVVFTNVPTNGPIDILWGRLS